MGALEEDVVNHMCAVRRLHSNLCILELMYLSAPNDEYYAPFGSPKYCLLGSKSLDELGEVDETPVLLNGDYRS